MANCSICDDTGWRTEERDGTSYAVRCDHGRAAAKPQPVGEILPRLIPVLLSPAERLIHDLVVARRGEAQAIKNRELVERLEGIGERWTERDVKTTIKKLRNQARLPIAATKSPPYGYFVPATAEECDACHDRLFGEGIELIVLSQLFRADSDLRERLWGQFELIGK
jgi:hypothetical protein